MLIDVPCSDLAQELSQNQPKTQILQDTLQQVLDRREEERQSKQLLELYLEALKNEGSILTKVSGKEHKKHSGGVWKGLNGRWDERAAWAIAAARELVVILQ